MKSLVMLSSPNNPSQSKPTQLLIWWLAVFDAKSPTVGASNEQYSGMKLLGESSNASHPWKAMERNNLELKKQQQSNKSGYPPSISCYL